MSKPFKAVLLECRRIIEAEPDDGWKTLTLRVLNDWSDHPDVETNWHAIETAATRGGQMPLSPVPLIEWVIEQAIQQKQLEDRFVTKHEHKRGKKLFFKTPSESLEDNGFASAETDFRISRDPKHADRAIEGAVKRVRAHGLRADRQRVLGRKPNPQRRFIAGCREMFLKNCGQPLDGVTEMLAFVVSGRILTGDAVRNALKPTTQAARDIRNRK